VALEHCSAVWLLSRCHGHFSFSKSLKPPEVFFEFSFAGRWIAVTVLSGLRLRLGTRVVVVVATTLVPVVAAATARVLFALATDSIVLGIGFVFFIHPGRDHVLEVGDGLGAAVTEVFEGAAVVEPVLEEVNDLLVGDIYYSGALVEEAAHVLAEGLALLLLHHS
jgi:hypothetical protein